MPHNSGPCHSPTTGYSRRRAIQRHIAPNPHRSDLHQTPLIPNPPRKTIIQPGSLGMMSCLFTALILLFKTFNAESMLCTSHHFVSLTLISPGRKCRITSLWRNQSARGAFQCNDHTIGVPTWKVDTGTPELFK